MPEENNTFNPNVIFERRKFVRVPANFVVSYADVGSGERKTDITQTKNISAGGLMFTTDREFSKGAILLLKLRLPESPDYIQIKVKVVGSEQKARGLLYETRVKFVGIRELDREAVKKIVVYNLDHPTEPEGEQGEK